MCNVNERFNRINSDRSIPTSYIFRDETKYKEVSIVSIQTDQSRPSNAKMLDNIEALFQSYQFRQSNPDVELKNLESIQIEPFQSYQFRQINPDL